MSFGRSGEEGYDHELVRAYGCIHNLIRHVFYFRLELVQKSSHDCLAEMKKSMKKCPASFSF